MAMSDLVQETPEEWARRMRLLFTAKEMLCKEASKEGELNNEYFLGKRSSARYKFWSEADAKKLREGIKKYGIGDWDRLVDHLDLHWSANELKSKVQRLMGRQSLAEYINERWRGDNRAIELEYARNKSIGTFLGCWKGGVLINDTKGVVQFFISFYPRDGKAARKFRSDFSKGKFAHLFGGIRGESPKKFSREESSSAQLADSSKDDSILYDLDDQLDMAGESESGDPPSENAKPNPSKTKATPPEKPEEENPPRLDSAPSIAPSTTAASSAKKIQREPTPSTHQSLPAPATQSTQPAQLLQPPPNPPISHVQATKTPSSQISRNTTLSSSILSSQPRHDSRLSSSAPVSLTTPSQPSKVIPEASPKVTPLLNQGNLNQEKPSIAQTEKRPPRPPLPAANSAPPMTRPQPPSTLGERPKSQSIPPSTTSTSSVRPQAATSITHPPPAHHQAAHIPAHQSPAQQSSYHPTHQTGHQPVHKSPAHQPLTATPSSLPFTHAAQNTSYTPNKPTTHLGSTYPTNKTLKSPPLQGSGATFTTTSMPSNVPVYPTPQQRVEEAPILKVVPGQRIYIWINNSWNEGTIIAKDDIVRRTPFSVPITNRPHAYFVHWDNFDVVTSVDLEPQNRTIDSNNPRRWCLQSEFHDLVRKSSVAKASTSSVYFPQTKRRRLDDF